MDWIRLLLLTSIAMLVLSLFSRWVEFKQSNPPLPASSVAQLPTNTNADNRRLPAFQKAQDVPLPTAPPSDTSAATNEAIKTNASESKYLEVRTDVLYLRINLRGGDIEYLTLLKYPKQQADPSLPFVLFEKNATRRFFAQSGLLSEHKITEDGKRPLYESDHFSYALQEDEDVLRVVLRYQKDHDLQIRKSFVFSRGSYRTHINYQIFNNSNDGWNVAMFGQLQRGDYPDPHGGSSTLSPASFLGVALNTPEKPYTRFKLKDIAKDPVERSLMGGWIALVQHYFVSAWVPSPSETHLYRAQIHNNDRYLASWVSPQYNCPPGGQTQISADLYTGPKIQKQLALMAPALDLTVDYGWLWWLAQPLAWLLIALQAQLHNWGLAIIALTFLVKLIFFPLSNIGYRSMARMRVVQPQIAALRERFAQDRQRMSQEMMGLYKKERINPMGGCLPILIQMPVFLALYWVLLESVELRHAPFFGWITDLSVMDPFFVLPVLMGISMFVQQKMNPTPPDPTQAAIMRWLPPIFTIFFLFFPAGLVLYWVINNLLSMLQQFIVNRSVERS